MENEFKSFYKTVGGNEGNLCYYPTRLDTYGRGCQHDCKYCYAKSLLDFRKMWNPDNVGVADIEKIARKVKRLEVGSTVRLGGMTDCFQPIEKKHRVTYQTIEELNNRGVHQLIVTKSSLVADDEYVDIMDRDLAHIQISITGNDEWTGKYENTPSFEERVNAIEKLERLGFDVSVRLSPFLTQLINIDDVNNIRCGKILVEFLRVNRWVEKWFGEYVNLEEYKVKSGGYRHLTLGKKKEYIELIENYDEMTVCEDVPEHYMYWKHNINANKSDCCNLRRND